MGVNDDVYMRPLRKTKSSLPDVYPQEAKQDEDDLCESNVKRGFNNKNVVHEYGSLKDFAAQTSLSKFLAPYNKIQTLKRKLNTLPDPGKKKLQINFKDNFWPVTARSKTQVTTWLQDLASSKPLSQLSKKVPIYNKKEEIFSNLVEHSVPMLRAAWFLKITNAYYSTVSENKMKKRANSDPAQEWTVALIKFLREQLNKLSEFYAQPNQNVGMHRQEMETAHRHWAYCIRLAEWMMAEELLDKQEFFHWLIELIDKYKNSHDDVLFKDVLPLILRHIDKICKSQILCRSLATHSIKKLHLLNIAAESILAQREDQPAADSKDTTDQGKGQSGSTSPVLAVLVAYNDCKQHRNMVTILSGILQAITLKCPTALIWSVASAQTGGHSDSSTKQNVLGSPLDKMPVAPSDLLNLIDDNESERRESREIKQALKNSEQMIIWRSSAVERRWLSPTNHETKSADETLSVLDILDGTNFHVAEKVGTAERVYEQIFDFSEDKQINESTIADDKPIINLLCDWAVTKRRYGKHRPLIAASVILMRHNYINEELFKQDQAFEEEDTVGQQQMPFTCVYQDILMDYLNQQAPYTPDLNHARQDESIQCLIILFGELIRNGVFNHDRYMCMLISHGDATNITKKVASLSLDANDSTNKSPVATDKKTGRKRQSSYNNDHDYQVGVGNFALDSEFVDSHQDLQNIINASPANEVFGITSPLADPTSPSTSSKSDDKRRCRSDAHAIYAMHFPIPNDSEGSHDNNQRRILLYGVGRSRNQEITLVKETKKELYTMFAELGKVSSILDEYNKKLSKGDLERKMDIESKRFDLMRKFQTLSTYDQYNLSGGLVSALLMIKRHDPEKFGILQALPSVHQVAFVLDFLEMSGNIPGILDIIQALGCQREMDYCETTPQTSSVHGTSTSKLMVMVSYIRKYFPCILISYELTLNLFRGLLQTVENISDPGNCTSTERCVMVVLHDMYAACIHVQMKNRPVFSTASGKIKDAICSPHIPSTANFSWNPSSFLSEYFKAPRHLKLDPIWEGHNNRPPIIGNNRPSEVHNFVCSAVRAVCRARDAEHLYDLSVLCCEVTSHIGALCPEWLGVFKAICCPTLPDLGFEDLVGDLKIHDSSVLESISFLICTLIGRHAFNMSDFLYKVAYPSLKCTVLPMVQGNSEASSNGARLVFHVLLQMLEGSIHNLPLSRGTLAYSPLLSTVEHGLLIGQLNGLDLDHILILLKQLLLIADSEPDSMVDDPAADVVFQSLFNIGSSELLDPTHSSVLFGDPFAKRESKKKETKVKDKSANNLISAKHVLQALTTQGWVRSRLLQMDQSVALLKGILDQDLSKPQQRKLLTYLTCRNLRRLTSTSNYEDFQTSTNRICQNIDRWSLNDAALDLQLLIRQSNKEDTPRLLNAIGQALMSALTVNDGNMDYREGHSNLIGPLISKLPVHIQGKILKSAAETMEKGKWWMEHEGTKLSSKSQTTLFTLISSCLRNQEENKTMFLNSLQKQLQSLVSAPEEEKIDLTLQARKVLLNALHLRLNLVGMLFDVIMSTPTVIFDWTVALFQILSSGIVHLHDISGVYSSMFTDLTDMIVILLQTVQLTEHASGNQSQTTSGEVQKYATLIRRLRKELDDSDESAEIRYCKQILPLHTPLIEFPTFEQISPPDVSQSGGSTPLNKDKSESEALAPERGIRVTGVQYISAWDILEDHKGQSPLSLAMFGAVKVDKKPLRTIEEARRLVNHSHQKRQNRIHFYEITPEELEEEEEEEEVKPLSQPQTPQTPATPTVQATTPNAEKGALHQLLTSVQPGSDSSQEESTKRQQPQKLQRQSSQKSKRSVSRSQSNPTQLQGKKFQQMLMQQQQRQMDGAVQMSAIPDVPPNVRLPQSGGQNQPDSAKAALQNLLNARNQANSNTMQAANPLMQLQQQLQRQQQQAPGGDMFNLVQDSSMNMMNQQKQQRQMMNQGPPPNVHMAGGQAVMNPPNQPMIYPNQPVQDQQQPFQNPMQPQFPGSNQQAVMSNPQPQQHQSTLRQLLMPNPQMLTPDQQMMRDGLMQRQHMQRMPMQAPRVQTQQALYMRMQRRNAAAGMNIQNMTPAIQRQLSVPDSGGFQPPIGGQPEMGMYQRQASNPDMQMQAMMQQQQQQQFVSQMPPGQMAPAGPGQMPGPPGQMQGQFPPTAPF